MNRYPNKSLKRKIEECLDGESDGGRASKEVKKEFAFEDRLRLGNYLSLQRLTPEDWAPGAASGKQDEEEEEDTNIEEDSERGSVNRGTLWTGKDTSQQKHKSPSQLSVACKRFANGSSSFDCETQTYYFLSNNLDGTSSTGSTFQDRIGKEDNAKNHDNLVKVCCVVDCESQSSESDSSVTYYGLPSSNTERSLWADILGVVFVDVPEETKQEICSKHFVASASSPDVCKSSPVPKSSRIPKSRTRKKKTCDILIAEEAEKVKQSMVTGRAKRTPKPNRNYDWAELIPLIKSEGDDIEERETLVSKSPVKHSSVPGRRRKQPLDDIKREEKENERPYIQVHLDLCNETGIPDLEAEDYGINISLPSLPRAPPPKPKGRPHKIQDTCTQTDSGHCTSKGPLREVKVQCNLTAEPLVTCSSCSSIDWKRLDEQLSSYISIIEGDFCNPVIARGLKKFCTGVAKPSHASNVLKMIAGIERDSLESGKDIILVSSQDDLEEVEIENVIHEEEAPITGMREITPKIWNKKIKTAKDARVKSEEITIEDHDSLGLKEATEKDDEEFQPEYAALEEEEEDEDLEMDDDDDWDIKNEDESGVPIPKKKKPRQKMKKELIGEVAEVSCRNCRKLYLNKEQFLVHRCKGQQADKSRRFVCNICGRGFGQKIGLQYHNVYIHNGERKAACPHCHYRAPDKAKLSLHLRKHSKARPFVCEICNSSFKFRATYRNHVARHTNSGKHVCTYCNKAFVRLSELEEHSQIHSLERPFVCSQCGMSFKQKKRLRVHLRAVHYQDKRFVCNICGSTHINNWNLRTHMKTHNHINIGYSNVCIHCGSTFRGKAGLAAHMRMRHPMMIVAVPLEEGELIEHILDPSPPVDPQMIEVFSCSLCGLLFESLDLLTDHTTEEHEVFIYSSAP